MCLIITLIMFGLAIQNIIQEHWIVGSIQFLIAIGFFVLLLRNIQKARCDRDGSCHNGCVLTGWITKVFTKKDH